MHIDLKEQLSKVGNVIRELSIEAVQKANSGHPGLPMGCAEFGAYLYGCVLRHNPNKPEWVNRDRFILSAGHGSMLLYSCLHLSGFNISIDEIKRFRQLYSITPGHPESHVTEGVESTTGPLGQGVGNAVGQALGFKILSAKFNKEGFPLFTNKIYCLAGDGCMMEGVSSEVSSLAGHLNLNNLVVIYDTNNVSLDGPLIECCSEDTAMRYRSYGWDVYDIDGYNFDQMEEVFTKIQEQQSRPCLILLRTIIGKGSPHKAGTHKVHGSPLGPEEVEATKKALGLPNEDFFVPPSVYAFFDERKKKGADIEEKWNALFKKWRGINPELARDFDQMMEKQLPEKLEEKLISLELPLSLASRSASQKVLDVLAEMIPHLYGGSADLSSSDMTMMKEFPVIAHDRFNGRNIKYGVREFGMATIAAGLFQTQMISPFVGTFLTFSDYMRNGIRLAALSHFQVIYQFTHDSIFLGEDGPTHQPVEHLAALRAIPGLQLIRPADNNEVKMAWIAALQYRGPTALILSRQSLPEMSVTKVPYCEGVGRGAYIVKKEKGIANFILLATGSEVSLAVDVAVSLEKKGVSVRVVSMPSWDLFEKQEASYRHSVLGIEDPEGTAPVVRVSIEAAVGFGWHKWIGSNGITISIETFGESAPEADLADKFGFTVNAIVEKLHPKKLGMS